MICDNRLVALANHIADEVAIPYTCKQGYLNKRAKLIERLLPVLDQRLREELEFADRYRDLCD